MSDNVFGDRHFSYREVPWHSLGLVSEQTMTAREAAEAVGANYGVGLFPLHVEINGHYLPLAERQIMRYPTPDDDFYRPFGTVGPEYTLIQPLEVADLWDKYVNKPVETLGVLEHGAVLFVTTKLPTMDVKGDEVERYLGLCSPMKPNQSASAEEWDIRVVCANTLRAAQANARVAYRVQHDAKVKEKLGEWLADAYAKAVANYANAKAAFEALADARASDETVRLVLKRAYPDPKLPQHNAPAATMARRLALYESLKPRIDKKRAEAFSLFGGDGTGMDTKAAKGTLWGAYNAVTETECHPRRVKDAEAYAKVAEAILFGDRSEVMQRAFGACVAASQGRLTEDSVSFN